MIDPKEVMDDIEWLRRNQPNNRKTWNVCEYAERWVIEQNRVGPTKVQITKSEAPVPPTECPVCAKKNKLKAASQKKRRARIAKEKAGI